LGALVAATVLDVTADGVGTGVGGLLGVGLGAVVGTIDGVDVAGAEAVASGIVLVAALAHPPVPRTTVASTTSIARIDRL